MDWVSCTSSLAVVIVACPLLGPERARHLFLKILSKVRKRYDFALIGYVVMPEHIHLLISEPSVGNPSTVMQVLKQRVSRMMHRRRRRAGPEMVMG
jgi:putative transposase